MNSCISCGNEFTGKYCNICGEKIIEQKEKSIKHLLGILINAFTFADSKLFAAVKLIITKPGMLSKYFSDGSRKKYFSPVSFFFLMNFIYFLFPIFETYNSTLNTQVTLTYHSSIAQKMLENKLAAKKMTFDEFNKIYAPKSENFAKTLIITNAFFLAAALQLFFFKRKKYFIDNLYFSFEYNSFGLLVNHFFFPILVYILIILTQMFGVNIRPYLNDSTLGTILLLTSFYFFVRGIKQFYNVKRIHIWSASILMLGVYIISIDLYRFVLFLVTMWTI